MHLFTKPDSIRKYKQSIRYLLKVKDSFGGSLSCHCKIQYNMFGYYIINNIVVIKILDVTTVPYLSEPENKILNRMLAILKI